MASVYFSDIAEQDLIDIYYFIAIENQAPEQAERFLSELRETTINVLSTTPLIGREYSEGIRFIVHKRYVITYCVQGNDVIIAEIYAPGRNWR